MEQNIQCDVLNSFHSGYLKEVTQTENGFMLTIDTSDIADDDLTSLFYCELVNCHQLELKLKKEIIPLNDIKDYKIELVDTEIIDNRLIMNCNLGKKNWATLALKAESITVYNKMHKKVPLLDLAIFDGLCTSGVGIDFHIGNTMREAQYADHGVKFNEDVHGYLWRRENPDFRYFEHEKRAEKVTDLLLNLDPYGEKIFTETEMDRLVSICETIILKYNSDHIEDQKARYFADKFKELCLQAKVLKKRIVAIGD